MRILVATDGSEHAEKAIRAVAELDPGPDARIRLVDVLPPSWAVAEGLIASAMDVERDSTIARGLSLLGPLAAHAEGRVVAGRPADAILSEAASFGADLILVGHGGRGDLAARLLGSVAAEVAERATCPVLVVRGPLDGPIVLADDGSRQARAARSILARWPLFAGREIHVVSVAHVPAPIASGVTVTVWREEADARRDEAGRSLAEHERVARDAEQELRGAGRDARGSAVAGDAAREILDAASRIHAGLIVVGCRGHGAVEALLGTVSRAVLLRSHCSVLVVHAPA